MSRYVLAFSELHGLDEVREGVRILDDLPDAGVEKVWEQEGDPGGYAVLSVARPTDLRDVLARSALDVEGMVELVQGENPLPSLQDLRVHRGHVVIGNASEYLDYTGQPIEWCDGCKTAHARGKHVR